MQSTQMAHFVLFAAFSSDLWYLAILVDGDSKWPTQMKADAKNVNFTFFQSYIRYLRGFQVANNESNVFNPKL